MEIDTSYWQLNNPSWVSERNEKWKIFLKWFDENDLWNSDYPVQQHRSALKKYYDTGRIDRKFTWWLDLAILHPHICETTVNELIQMNFENGNTSLKGQYLFYAANAYSYRPLVNLGFFKENDLKTISVTFCGNDYIEMSKLREFDANEQLCLALDKMLGWVGSWLIWCDPDDKPIEIMFSHAKSMLTLVRPEHIESLSFRLNRNFRNLGRYKQIGSSNPESQMRIANEMKEFILSDSVHLCVSEIARYYINADK